MYFLLDFKLKVPYYLFIGEESFMIKNFKAKSNQSNRKPKTVVLEVDFKEKKLISRIEVNNIKMLLLELKAQEQGLSEAETSLFLAQSLKRMV